jgi:hypothetical protein
MTEEDYRIDLPFWNDYWANYYKKELVMAGNGGYTKVKIRLNWFRVIGAVIVLIFLFWLLGKVI